MFKIARELNLLLVMVDLDHVFIRLAVENDLSGVQDVAGFTIISLQILMKFGIIFFLASDNDFNCSRISLKHTGFKSEKMVFHTSPSDSKSSTSTSPSPYFSFKNYFSFSTQLPVITFSRNDSNFKYA